MAGQETLIYIDENDQLDAGISAKNFTKEDIQNRAYYNTLGAKLAQKFLASENIDVSNIYNIHNIKKILEELDISDIMLKNIHLDVRVVFNENYIFIPKSHFEYDILPDIYIVLLMSNDKKYMKFLGFFEPKLVNKNNQNEEYYFIEKEKLSQPANLKEFIQNYNGNTSNKLSDSEIDESDMLILSMIDHDITEKDKKQLLKNLVKSADLRDRFIEFENFELLAYKAEHSPDIVKSSSFDVSMDKAAAATAAALQEFTSAQIQEETPKDTEIMNGFNNLERNLPDFTPENAAKTLDEYQNELTGETFEVINEAPAVDEIQMPESDNNNTAIEIPLDNNAFVQEDSLPVDLDSLGKISDNNNENNELEVENIAVNLDELPALDVSSSTTEEITPETVNLDELDQIAPEKNDVSEITPETVNLEDITPVVQEEHKEQTTDEVQETLSFDDIEPLNAEISENSLTEPALELEDIDNLTLDETPTPEENSIEPAPVEIEDLHTSDEDILNSEHEAVLDENMPPELNFDENLTLDELHIQEEDSSMLNTSAEIEAESAPAALPSDLPEINQENTVNLDSNENIPPVNMNVPADEPQQEALSEEDKELDAMLAFENLTGENDTDTEDNDSVEITESLTPPDTSAENSDDINLDDLKDLGLDVNVMDNAEPQNADDANTGDLISEIDDLLSSEEDETKPEALNSSDENNDNKLEMLFNSGEMNEDSYSQETDEDGNFIDPQKVSAPEKGKKAIIVAAALVAVLAAAAGAGLFLKSKNDMNVLAQNPIENDNRPRPASEMPPAPDNTDIMTNTPDGNPAPAPAPIQDNTAPAPAAAPAPAPAPSPAQDTPKPAKPDKPAAAKTDKKPQAEAKPAPQTQNPKPAGKPTPYVSVKSLTWEVPDYLSYSDNVKSYLQTAGKSIRLTLSSDLLLANEYAYSNQVKVEMKLKNNGSIEDIQITKSSGSNQINDIVLRTVKDTLNVVKPASGEIPTDNFKLGLIINF